MPESDLHKHLKKMGMYFLKKYCVDLVCIEAKYRNLRSIADVAGINLKRKEVRIIECKASKQDFLRDKKLLDINKSYYGHCHYFYILCPEGIIKKEDMPKEYGLLYLNDKDEINVIQSPKKYKEKLKTSFNTSLKNISRAITNTLLYYFENKENKDDTNGKFKRNAKIIFAAIRCPNCKHITKELINKEKTINIKCKNCKQLININNTHIREITAYNETFIKKINKLNEE